MWRSCPASSGQGRGVDVGAGCLQRGVEQQRHVGRGGVVPGRLGSGGRIDAFDLSSRERPVLADLELGEVVVEAVGAHADVAGELLGRLGAHGQQLEQADAQRIGQGAMDRPQPW